MKKNCILFLLLIATGSVTNAQEFKKFKVGLGVGYASTGSEGAMGGLLFYLEPAYRISDAISLGLRLEGALVLRGFSQSVSTFELDAAVIRSYTINGQYYFSNNTFRPYAGFGLGIFSLTAIKSTDPNGTTAVVGTAESKFGVYPRVGFDLGHFNMSVDYNIIPKTEAFGGNFKNSYLGIRLGFSIGGGKK